MTPTPEELTAAVEKALADTLRAKFPEMTEAEIGRSIEMARQSYRPKGFGTAEEKAEREAKRKDTEHRS